MLRARPTIRCLTDELATSPELDPSLRSALAARDLVDVGSRPLDEIAHPLLDKATNTLSRRPLHEIHHLKISAVLDNVFYRVRVGQLRGAAWIDPDGRPWLCTAGMRRDGDVDDFYAEFGRRCLNGSQVFLPTDRDRRRLLLERANGADEARIRLLRRTVVWAIAQACKEGVGQSVMLPTLLDPDSLAPRDGATLHVEVVPGDDETGDLTLSLVITDYAAHRYEDIVNEVQGAIPGLPLEDWDVIPARGIHADPCWYALIDTSWVARLHDALAQKGLEAFIDNPPNLSDGSDGFTHIVPKAGLMEAIVSSTIIKGLCGRTFVPGRDPAQFPVCPECVTAETALVKLVTSREV